MANWLAKLFRRRGGQTEKRMDANPMIAPLVADYADRVFNRDAPRDVGQNGVMGLTAAWNAVNIYANSIACMDFYVANQDGTRSVGIPAPEHPVNRVVAFSPNGKMTKFKLRQTMQAHALIQGNAYAEIVWQNRAKYIPDSLHLMSCKDTEPFVDDDGTVSYKSKSTQKVTPGRDVIHVAGLGFDGVKGYCPLTLFRRSFGLAMKQEIHETGLMDNNATPNGFLQVDRRLQDTEKTKLRNQFEEMHRGPENSGRVGVLDNGLKWVQTSFSPEDTQLLLSRQFSVAEIARIFNIPQYMLGLLEHATLNNIESLDLQFFKYCLMPWITAYQEEFDIKLFHPKERDRYMVAVDPSRLLRGDRASLVNFCNAAFDRGAMNRDEYRMTFGMSPVPNGDIYFVAGNNLTPIGPDGIPIMAKAPATPKPGDPPASVDPDAANEDTEPADTADEPGEPLANGSKPK